MKEGDILAFSGDNIASTAIKLLTFGLRQSISHVGVLARHKGRLKLFESTYENGLECVPVQTRISRYIGRVWLYPLSRDLYGFESERLTDFLTTHLGAAYDLKGAVKAGGFLLASAKAKASRPDLTSLFCSETVAAAHNAIGIFPTPNPSRWSPNTLVRAERRLGILLAPERLR